MLLTTIEIPKFITHVVLSQKRRAVYYKKGDKIPKKYTKTKIQKGYVVDENGNKIIKNSRSVGTPKEFKLAGNDFYSGYQHPSIRAKIVRELKSFYRPFIQEHIINHGSITKFPLRIEWEVYTTVDSSNWDASNLHFYYKYFEDCLFESTDFNKNFIKYKNKNVEQLIPDDSIKYITHPASPKIIPIDDWNDRKFIFKFYYDNRDELQRKPWI